MVETRVEDQVRRMAPQLIGGQRAFFTEENLQAAFPDTRNLDVGADWGGADLRAGRREIARRHRHHGRDSGGELMSHAGGCYLRNWRLPHSAGSLRVRRSG